MSALYKRFATVLRARTHTNIVRSSTCRMGRQQTLVSERRFAFSDPLELLCYSYRTHSSRCLLEPSPLHRSSRPSKKCGVPRARRQRERIRKAIMTRSQKTRWMWMVRILYKCMAYLPLKRDERTGPTNKRKKQTATVQDGRKRFINAFDALFCSKSPLIILPVPSFHKTRRKQKNVASLTRMMMMQPKHFPVGSLRRYSPPPDASH